MLSISDDFLHPIGEPSTKFWRHFYSSQRKDII